MNYSQYKEEAIKTMNQNMTDEEKVEYCLLKLMEEAGELLGSYAKQKFHKSAGNDTEEIGDILWYIANVDNVLNSSSLTNMIESRIDREQSESRYEDTLQYRIEIYRSALVLGEQQKNASGNWTYYRDKNISLIASYVMKTVNAIDQNVSDIMVLNIDKLRKRHGEQYNAKHYQKA